MDNTALAALITSGGAVTVAVIDMIATRSSRKSVKALKEEIKDQREKLAGQKVQLDLQDASITDLRKTVGILTKDNERLTTENTELRCRLSTLEETGLSTNRKVKNLEIENKSLKEKIDFLTSENRNLEQENAALKLRIDQLEKANH